MDEKTVLRKFTFFCNKILLFLPLQGPEDLALPESFKDKTGRVVGESWDTLNYAFNLYLALHFSPRAKKRAFRDYACRLPEEVLKTHNVSNTLFHDMWTKYKDNILCTPDDRTATPTTQLLALHNRSMYNRHPVFYDTQGLCYVVLNREHLPAFVKVHITLHRCGNSLVHDWATSYVKAFNDRHLDSPTLAGMTSVFQWRWVRLLYRTQGTGTGTDTDSGVGHRKRKHIAVADKPAIDIAPGILRDRFCQFCTEFLIPYPRKAPGGGQMAHVGESYDSLNHAFTIFWRILDSIQKNRSTHTSSSYVEDRFLPVYFQTVWSRFSLTELPFPFSDADYYKESHAFTPLHTLHYLVLPYRCLSEIRKHGMVNLAVNWPRLRERANIHNIKSMTWGVPHPRFLHLLDQSVSLQDKHAYAYQVWLYISWARDYANIHSFYTGSGETTAVFPGPAPSSQLQDSVITWLTFKNASDNEYLYIKDDDATHVRITI